MIEDRKKRPEGMEEENYQDESMYAGKIRGSYWDLVEFKLAHDQLLVESMMSDAYSIENSLKPTLLCANLCVFWLHFMW